jgi:hypothetical protein
VDGVRGGATSRKVAGSVPDGVIGILTFICLRATLSYDVAHQV